jgi:hypothetical protein
VLTACIVNSAPGFCDMQGMSITVNFTTDTTMSQGVIEVQ